MSPSNRRRCLSRRVGGVLLAGALLVVGTSVAHAEGEEEASPRDRSRLGERWQNATPTERRALRAEVRERWEDASPGERRRAARRLRALERALPEFSAIERWMLLRAAAELPRAERRALRARLRTIDDQEPAARRALVADLEEMLRGRADEIERFERNRDRWEAMSESERQEAREQMEKLREMSVEERRKLLREMEAAKGR